MERMTNLAGSSATYNHSCELPVTLNMCIATENRSIQSGQSCQKSLGYGTELQNMDEHQREAQTYFITEYTTQRYGVDERHLILKMLNRSHISLPSKLRLFVPAESSYS
jgi:hypothetical protein